MADHYVIQKRIARKHLLRARELRGTPQHRGALKRAQYELNRLLTLAVRHDKVRIG